MKFVTVFLMTLFVSLCTSPLCAETYFWTDQNGVKHYTDTPPPDKDDLGVMESLEREDDGEAGRNKLSDDNAAANPFPPQETGAIYESGFHKERGDDTIEEFTLGPGAYRKVSVPGEKTTRFGFRTNLTYAGIKKCQNQGIRFSARHTGDAIEAPAGGAFTVDPPDTGIVELEVRNLEDFSMDVQVYRR